MFKHKLNLFFKHVKTNIVMKCSAMVLILIIASGCSVSLALRQPDWKDVEKIVPGSNINYASAVLGTTYVSERKIDNESKIYNYTFVQGYTKGEKAAKVAMYVIADIFTLFLWEIAGTAIELAFTGDEQNLQIKANNEGVVMEVIQEDSGD